MRQQQYSTLNYPDMMGPATPPQQHMFHHHQQMNPAVFAPIIQVEDDKPSERTSTDVGWMVAFVIYLFGGLIIASHALSNGKPAVLYKGVNNVGLVCGSDPGVRTYPYVYYPLDTSTGKILTNDGRCVSSCPSEEDVQSKATISTTRRISREHDDLGTKMFFEFDVATPAYASSVVANSYCLPIDMSLRSQLMPKFSSLKYQLSFAIGGLSSAWVIMIRNAITGSFVAFLIANWLMKSAQYGLVLITTVCFPAALFFGGFYCVAAGLYGSISSITSPLYSVSYSWSLLIGLVMLATSVAVAIFYQKSVRGRERISKVGSFTCSVYKDVRNICVGPLIMTAVSVIFFLFWLAVFIHLCGLTTTETYTDSVFSSGVMSQFASPVYKKQVLPLFSYFCLTYWIILLFWCFGVFRAILEFVVAYTGTVWYFAQPEGYEQREASWCPVLVALSIGLTHHLGSFAFGGIVMGITSPLRTLCSWAADKNTILPDESVIFLQNLSGSLLTPIRSVVDFFTTGAYVETAISSTDMWTALTISSRRLSMEGSPSARLSGALGGAMNCFSAMVSLCSGFIVYSLLSTSIPNPYNSPTSAYFVSSPLLVAVVNFFVCWSLTYYHFGALAILADSVFYSYLVESTSQQGEIDEVPTDKIHASPELRDLIADVLDEYSE